MDIKDFIPAVKKTLKEIGGLVDDFTGTPVFGTAERLLNIKGIYHKAKLERNVKAFVEGLKAGEKEKVLSAIQRLAIESNEDDFVIMLLDVLANSLRPLKAELMAGLIIALSNDDIDIRTFETCSLMVAESQTQALRSLNEFYISNEGASYWKGTMISAHPVEGMLNSLGVAERHGSQLTVSKYGEAIYKYGFRGNLKNKEQ